MPKERTSAESRRAYLEAHGLTVGSRVVWLGQPGGPSRHPAVILAISVKAMVTIQHPTEIYGKVCRLVDPTALLPE